MGYLRSGVVVAALVTLAWGRGIPYPRPQGDDPYSSHSAGGAAPHREEVTPTTVYLPYPTVPTPSPDLNFSTPAPRVGSTLHAVKFMQKFGYIPKGSGDADFLYTPQALEEHIKKMQKFGDIEQTGVIDDATIELMQTPRCGVADVERGEETPGEHSRPKRYIIGSGGWNKRHLTYYLANWSPQLYSKEKVQKELRRAFDAWTTYSHLQFTEINDGEARDGRTADIIIFFATYDHSDGYAFDGPSGILAHAYYPYEFGHYGGDVHFDESEKWTITPKDEYDGLDFFTVAVHEIGHSLGLAHSPVGGSIMFPYYKGFNKDFALDYDDVMAMWELYIKRRLEGDDEYFNSTTTTTPRTPTHDDDDDHQSDAGDDGDADDTQRRPGEDDIYEQDRKRREKEEKKREEERKRKQEDEEERRRWEEDVRRKEAERRREEEAERRRWEEEEERHRWNGGSVATTTTTTAAPPTVPDVCNGHYDAVAVLRQELFVFKDTWLWRFTDKGVMRPGYPAKIRSLFSQLPDYMQRIDAVYERPLEGTIIFFIGKYYYVHNGDRLVDNSPRPITDLGLPSFLTKIDAAFYWPRAKKSYFFSRDTYYRYNETSKAMDHGYPKPMSKWNGLPDHLDSVFTWLDGTSYFVRGRQYWKYDNKKIRPFQGFPQDFPHHWSACPATSTTSSHSTWMP